MKIMVYIFNVIIIVICSNGSEPSNFMNCIICKNGFNFNSTNNNYEKIEEEESNTILVVVSIVGRTVIVSEGTGTVIYVKKKKIKNEKVKLNIEADVNINSKKIDLNIISGSSGEKGEDEKNNK